MSSILMLSELSEFYCNLCLLQVLPRESWALPSWFEAQDGAPVPHREDPELNPVSVTAFSERSGCGTHQRGLYHAVPQVTAEMGTQIYV